MANFEFRAKRVLVTGGGSGIGLAIAQAMARAGASVTITGRDAGKLESVARDNPKISGRVCDVTDDHAILALRDELMAAGGIDVLINNAGVMDTFQILDGYPLEKQIREVNIDAIGPIRMIHHLIPMLRKQRAATIVNVSSGLAYVPYADAPVYSAAKAFLHAYTQCLREQLRDTTIRVVELLPPVVDTLMVTNIETPFAPMAPEKLAAALMSGLSSGKAEIAPGFSGPLKWVNRLLPALAFRLMNPRK